MTAQGKEFGGTWCSVEQGRKVFPASGSPSAKTLPGAHLDAGRTLARQQTLLHCLMSISPPLSLLEPCDALLVTGPKTRQLRTICSGSPHQCSCYSTAPGEQHVGSEGH